MQNFEMNKLTTAREIIARMSEGRDPIANQPLPKEHLLNNPIIVRALCFVENVLGAVVENNAQVGRKLPKTPFIPFPLEILQTYTYDSDLTITYFIKQLCAPIDDPAIMRITPLIVLRWMKKEGYLEEKTSATGKKKYLPTEKGRALGLYTKARIGLGGEYETVFYNREAQELIVGNMAKIINAQEVEAPSGNLNSAPEQLDLASHPSL